MTKDATGFEAKVKVPWGTTVEYKFLVDGHWKTSENAPTETDPCVYLKRRQNNNKLTLM